MHYILSPILKLRKLRPERVTFPLAPTPCVMCVCVCGGGWSGVQVFTLEVLGAIPGLSQADPPPKSLAWGASGCPRLGWGSWRHSSREQPPVSYITGAAWESPGREAAELLGFFVPLPSCSLCPFVSLSAEALSAPPAGLFVTNHWRLYYLPGTISSSPLLNAAPKEGVHHRLPCHRAGLGMGKGQRRGSDALAR